MKAGAGPSIVMARLKCKLKKGVDEAFVVDLSVIEISKESSFSHS